MLLQRLTFSVLVSELKGLDQTQGLLNRASHWEVIDGDLSQNALVIDDEQTPETERSNNSWVSKDLERAETEGRYVHVLKNLQGGALKGIIWDRKSVV